MFDSQNIVSKPYLLKRGKNKDGTPKKWADRCGQLLTDIHGQQVVTIPVLGAWWEVEPAEAAQQQQPAQSVPQPAAVPQTVPQVAPQVTTLATPVVGSSVPDPPF